MTDDFANVSGNCESGAIQSLGLGYLTRWLDIDLSKRAATTGSSQIASNQRPIDNRSEGSLLGLPVDTWGLLVVGGLLAVAAWLALKG